MPIKKQDKGVFREMKHFCILIMVVVTQTCMCVKICRTVYQKKEM